MYHFKYYSPIMLVAFYSSEKPLHSIMALERSPAVMGTSPYATTGKQVQFLDHVLRKPRLFSRKIGFVTR